ncbi:hydantoinase/oxoprolinase family protein [Salinibacter ruber]|uniref:N-methylhydantoinase A/oxoprolinase/acetone carboxylase beta subunit n=1 Tax=Salinibacter ruber TaxID=146919 RepID=A0AAW5PAJ7_9BACT|nr:hydantoinase/oxoprolinase family protein [Salinibacter ruber]MCS4158872.1 N-methylhydantoinase A/oxoprolinase/acetone carboxylase beta subunit [Salinibacter ruber]
MPASGASDTDGPSEVGIDVGGTFTDFVVATGAGLEVRKVPTTDPQHEAVGTGLGRLDVPPAAPIAHGTTTATNALLERQGAKAALVTTEGFADVLAIGRQDRPDLYDLTPTRPDPLVPAARRHEVPERISAEGDILTPLDEAAVRRVARVLEEQNVQSVALAFLFSYRNPEHEKRAAELLRDELPEEIPVTRSSALLPEHREYERVATTVANAYVRPRVERYLTRLGGELGERPVRVMQSSGGTIGPGPAGKQAARLALSGPAGGVVGALGVARRALGEAPRVMTLDMAPEAARSAVGRLGETLGRSLEETALGVLRVANATMERALRRVSVERGHDPRDYTLVPFGGAGPLHAAALAEALGMPRVLVPPAPGALSALGLLMADVTHDASRALLTSVGTLQGDPASIQRAASALAEDVESALEGHGTPEVTFELDLRYAGQSYEVTVPLASPVTASALGGAAEAFHDRHRRRYGHAAPEAPVEAVALRARGTVPVSPPPLPQEPETDLPLRDAEIGTRPVWFSPGGPAETTAYARTALHHGHTLEGPAVLHQYDTTIVVPPGWRARVDAYRNVWIER